MNFYFDDKWPEEVQAVYSSGYAYLEIDGGFYSVDRLLGCIVAIVALSLLCEKQDERIKVLESKIDTLWEERESAWEKRE